MTEEDQSATRLEKGLYRVDLTGEIFRSDDPDAFRSAEEVERYERMA